MSAPGALHDWLERAHAAGRSGAPTLLAEVQCAALATELGSAAGPGLGALVAAVTESRDVSDASIEAVPAGRSWLLSGVARHVTGGAHAGTFMVVARSRPLAGRDRGLRVYRVPAAAPGVSCVPRSTLDDDGAARVALDAVTVTDADAIGPPRDASAAVTRALDTATLVAVAEMLGAAGAALDAAVAWVTARHQFGAPLAAKQAVQHRVADMTMACAAVRALLDDAVSRAAAGAPFEVEATVAKLVASERLPLVTAGAHQLHGGEGYYADRPLHRRHRRVVSLALQLGDPAAQRRRLAGLLPAPSTVLS